MERNDREAAFTLVQTEEEKQAAGKMPAVKGAHFQKAGPREIRYAKPPRTISVWTVLALAFFVPLVSFVVINYLKG